MIRVAAFNVENLFERAKAMNLATWADGRQILDLYAALNKLLQKTTYTTADKARIGEMLVELGLERSDTSEFVQLRQNRGRLVKRPRGGGLEIVATGRRDWIGWIELRTEMVDEISTRNTAQVIRDVAADIIGVVEAEHRTSLKRFNTELLPAVNGSPFDQVMLIDGNDDRGIDVGLFVRSPIRITRMCSHVDDTFEGRLVFSRDCPEYELRLSSGTTLLVLVNHFKSKGYGSYEDSNARRRRQAERVAEIYNERRSDGVDNMVVLGDFNDPPESEPLAPLLADTDMKDISGHRLFVSDGRPGTYRNGTAVNKIDYILLSPALWQRVARAGVLRKGVWGGTNGTLWPIYPEMTEPHHAASDHAALWVDLELD